jgi:hypothetical protein
MERKWEEREEEGYERGVGGGRGERRRGRGRGKERGREGRGREGEREREEGERKGSKKYTSFLIKEFQMRIPRSTCSDDILHPTSPLPPAVKVHLALH